MSLAIYFDRLCQHIEKNSLRGFATFWWQILVVNLLGTSQNKHASEARELSSPFLSQLHHILRGTRLSWCQYWFIVHSAKSCTGPCKDQSDVQSMVWLETLVPWKSDYHIAFRLYSDWISAYRNIQSTLTHTASTQWNEADNKKQFISNKCITCPWQYTYFPHAEENQHKVHLNKGLLVLRQA